MHTDFMGEIENKITQYKDYWSNGAYFTATIYLGEIFYRNESNMALKKQFCDLLKTVHITDDILRKIEFKAEKEKRNLENILIVGGEYLYEEMILIFSKRMNLFLITSFLGKKFGIVIAIDLDEIDEMICELYKQEKNRNHFKQGLDRMKSCFNYSPELIDFLDNLSKCKLSLRLG